MSKEGIPIMAMEEKFDNGLEAVIRATGMFVSSDRTGMVKSISKKVGDFLCGVITWKDVTDTIVDEVKYYAADWWSDYASEQRACIANIKSYIYEFVMGSAA